MFFKDIKNKTIYKINKKDLKPFKNYLVYNKDRAMLFDQETKILLLSSSNFNLLLKALKIIEKKIKEKIIQHKKAIKLQTEKNSFNKFVNYDNE